MNAYINGATLNVSGIRELGAANSQRVRDEITSALGQSRTNIEIDLSATTYLDSCGLGTLVSLHKEISKRKGTFRLLYPTPPVQQILELTRLHRLFEIVKPCKETAFVTERCSA